MSTRPPSPGPSSPDERLKRLLRITDGRNRRLTNRHFSVSLDRETHERLKAKLKADGMSMTVITEAIVQGYLANHPAVLAMLDQWMRDHRIEAREVRVPTLRDRDLDGIYDRIGDVGEGE